MNILLIGSGGREHAIAWKLAESELLEELYIAPGNPGTANLGVNLPISINEFEKIADAVDEYGIDIVIIGPEQPLVDGLTDFLEYNYGKTLKIIGPSKEAAQLEGSKEFAKLFMSKYNIPTAKYKSFAAAQMNEAISYLDTINAPYVLKADGLAAGKGVFITENKSEAITELKEMFLGKFGKAGDRVVIEEFLSGIELSVFVLTDGSDYVILPNAKDYKRVGEKDSGLNTGGMGAVSPVSFATPDFMKKVEETIIKPTVQGIKRDNLKYVGFIFFGLIKVGDNPFVIEYNVRLGDPETEVVMPLINSDLLELLNDAATESLKGKAIDIDPGYACTVMMVSGGYPQEFKKDYVITGLNNVSDSLIFHAGTTFKNNDIVTSGGRVLAVTSLGNTKQQALETSYQSIQKIEYIDMYFRTDIGFDLE